jgi:AcrR family transcriptional regulator
LFLERGYDGVTVREVADAADVSATTLLNHFPSKEALVFDEEADIEAGLVAAVRQRAAGVSIPQALRAFIAERQIASHLEDPRFGEFLALIPHDPRAGRVLHRMWMRHQDAPLRRSRRTSAPRRTTPHAQALARFTLESTALARRSADPQRALDAAFDLLERVFRPPRPTR